MTLFVYDRVCETTTGTGTGNLTLAGAIPGFRSFADAGVSSTSVLDYLIEAVDANGVATGDWEIGVGTVETGVLTRLYVSSSSNSGSLVAFSAGTKRVHLCAPAQRIAFNGALVYRSTDLTAQNFTTATAIQWSGANPDTDSTQQSYIGYYSVSSPSRITFPAVGYDTSIARLMGQVRLQNITANDWVELSIRRDGSVIVARSTFVAPTTSPTFQIWTGVEFPGGGSYYELMVQVGADTSVDMLGIVSGVAQSFFQLEVLQ